MPKFEGFRVIPASMWVLMPPEKQELMRSVGGFPVNDAFIPLWERPRTLKKEFLILYGTYGSSKTVDRIQELIFTCITEKYFKCFYGRDLFDLAKKELHSSIVSAIERLGLQHLFEYSKKDNGSKNITCIANGNIFKAFGCDDEQSIGKGWDDATHIFIDEMNQISFKTFGMLQSRLRKIDALKCFIGCFNNCDVLPDHWICTNLLNREVMLVDDKGKLITRNIIEHFSTYTDNYFIDHEDYKNSLVEQAGHDTDRLEAILQGKWGAQANSQPFYKDFRRAIHVKYNAYDPNLALWVAWDENSNPYLPASIWQFKGLTARCIWEVAGRNPHNTLEWVCGQIVKKYGPQGHKHESGALICGDATSVKQDVKMEKGKNMYTKIKEHLTIFRPRLRVGRSNPNVAMRRDFVNDIFRINKYGLSVEINPECKLTIADLENTGEAPDGTGKDKTKTRVDGVAGVQKWGHFTDCADYVLCEGFAKQYAMYRSGNITGVSKPEMYFEPRQARNQF
jgi:phage terminase large subunit